MIKFASSKFISAIRGPKGAEKREEIQNFSSTNKGGIFTFTLQWGNICVGNSSWPVLGLSGR